MRDRHVIQVDRERCIGCGLCRQDCPVSDISILESKAVILSQDCIQCGHCVAVCPQGAVTMTGFDDPAVELEGPVALDPGLLLEAIRSRRSVRRFADRPVDDEAIAQIIEAGRWTPTGKNAQDVSYLVLREGLEAAEEIAVRLFRRLLPLAKLLDPGVRRAEIDDRFFFKGAPAVILVLCRDKVNGALAASNMELMAEAHGLGVLYSGFFAMAANRSRPLRKLLGLARGDRAVTALVLGHPGVRYHRTAQKERASVRIL